MPVWGIAVSLALIAVISGVALVGPTLRGDATPYVRPSDAFQEPSPTATVEPVVVSVLSDSHAYNEGSWWRQTVLAGTVPGAVTGAFESQPGANAEVLLDRMDGAAANGGLVLIQAGTNDLLSAITPADTVARVAVLWDGIAARGATPVAVLVPPSATRAAETAELNALLTEAATARGIAVIDVYTPVTNGDGTWIEGYSGDGIHALPDGAALMADAAREQLTALVAG